VLLESRQHFNALNLFSKAIKIFPENKEGYAYRFLVYIDLYLMTYNTE